VLTFLDLFNALEGDDLPDDIRTDPDQAIQQARLALNGKYDLETALSQIDDQVQKLRKALRAVRFNMVKQINSERGIYPDKINRLGTELHQLAALMCMKQNRLQDARYHLMRALACDPGNKDTQFYFVQLYEQSSEFMEAFDQLDRTFGKDDSFDKYYRLFQLTWNIHRKDPASAIPLYEKLSGMASAGFLGELAKSEIMLIKDKVERPPDPVLKQRLQKGLELIDTGDLGAALGQFTIILCWYPFNFFVWSIVGDLFFGSVTALASETALITVYDGLVLEEDHRAALLNAIQAGEMALTGDPGMARAYLLLIKTYILLTDYDNALRLAEIASRQVPDDLQLWGLYALTSSFVGQFEKAKTLADRVIEQDPAEFYALRTVERLERANQ